MKGLNGTQLLQALGVMSAVIVAVCLIVLAVSYLRGKK